MILACEKRFVRFEFRSRQNKGLCATLNEALIWCNGLYFSVTASDDILRGKKISRQVSLIEEKSINGVVGVFVGIEIIDSNKKVLKKRGMLTEFGFKEVFLRSKFMPGQAAMLRRDVVRSEERRVGKGYRSG